MLTFLFSSLLLVSFVTGSQAETWRVGQAAYYREGGGRTPIVGYPTVETRIDTYPTCADGQCWAYWQFEILFYEYPSGTPTLFGVQAGRLPKFGRGVRIATGLIKDTSQRPWPRCRGCAEATRWS